MHFFIPFILVMQFRYLTRDEIMDSTRPFAEVEWMCDSANAAPVPECPDWYSDYEVGHVYRGMAYEYGGWDRVGQFLANLENGLRAGSHSDNDCLPSGYGDPPWATGQDCSGLVSRAWQLPYKHSTRMLPNISHEIDWDELEAGDVINKPGVHVVIFDVWAQPGSIYMFIYQATDRRPNPSTTARDMRNVLNYQASGYIPMRYNYLLNLEEEDGQARTPLMTFRTYQYGDDVDVLFDLPMNQVVSFSIFDASGRKVLQFDRIPAQKGTNRLTVKLNKSGVYFVVLRFLEKQTNPWILKFLFIKPDKM